MDTRDIKLQAVEKKTKIRKAKTGLNIWQIRDVK